MEKTVSIIMVNYNGVKYIGQENLCAIINSFLKTDYENFEFIFVDNNSDDDSISYVKSIFDDNKNIKTNIVKTVGNLGFAGGCNEGMKFANGEYICLVNNDDKALGTKWLINLANVLESDKNIGVVFAKKMRWDNEGIIDAVGLTMNRAGLIVQSGNGDIDNEQYNDIKECLIWQTPLLFRKNITDDIGKFFDDDYVILNDDTDSSLRIWLAGYKIVYVPSSIVSHIRSATMKHLPIEFVAFHGRKNTIQTLIKNYDIMNLIMWLPITLFIYSSASIYYVYIKRYDHARATVNAIFWNITHIRNTIKKRRIIQKLRTVGDSEIMKHMASLNMMKIISGDKVWPK